jgi:hypothetical protein
MCILSLPLATNFRQEGTFQENRLFSKSVKPLLKGGPSALALEGGWWVGPLLRPLEQIPEQKRKVRAQEGCEPYQVGRM